MNVRELREFLADFNEEVEVVLMDKRGRIYEMDDDFTIGENYDLDGLFEATMFVGLVAGNNIPRNNGVI